MITPLMTGPEHFAAAERLLDRVDRSEPGALVPDHILLEAATVHATLALTAAVASFTGQSNGDGSRDEWQAVAGR